MSRLLAISGDVVGVRTAPDKGTVFTITAYDPASGLYIGMGHQPVRYDLVGRVPLLAHGVVSATGDQLLVERFERHPLLGSILWQSHWGVCGRLVGQIDAGVVDTARAEKGPACIVTAAQTLDATVQGQRPRLMAVPIEITDVTAGDTTLFAFTAFEVKGTSGSPIVQNGHLVGAVFGTRDGKGAGRHIGPMEQGLLGKEVRSVTRHRPTGKVKSATLRQLTARSNTTADWLCRTQRGMTYYQALVNEAPKMARLEAQVRQYEAGRISGGILYGTHKRTYQEALRLLWDYQTARWQMALNSWRLAGTISKAQYRAILEACTGYGQGTA